MRQPTFEICLVLCEQV